MCGEIFFQDTDFLMLYGRRYDGIEDPDGDVSRQLGVGDLRAAVWFEPFQNVDPRDPRRGSGAENKNRKYARSIRLCQWLLLGWRRQPDSSRIWH
ncbi:hypothetical protein ACFVX9_03920 [Kitasatospora sp. NPDC058243]|uniref:hypothetical protein n=1 Tax=Kitasatospora sp. NPDC058243 TaxID=3346397 RepID=UPI0036DEBBEA